MAGGAIPERSIRAALLAGAMGDALGAAIEFASIQEIRRRHPDGPSSPAPAYGMDFPITDDTQMTLFTGEGLLDAFESRGPAADPVPDVHAALLRWYATQTGEARGVAGGALGLVADPRLHRACAPGVGTMAALGQWSPLGTPVHNDRKGCGSVMRVAPVAFAVPRARVRQVAVETSALTHGHATGQLAAAAWAELLAEVARGAELEEAARRIGAAYRELPEGAETAAAVEAALKAPDDGAPATVESLGAGWIAEEALAIGLYAARVARGRGDVESGLRVAVTHSGDSDSTGAIAGNLIGLIAPEATLSHPWVEKVECADLLVRLAARLAEISRRAEVS